MHPNLWQYLVLLEGLGAIAGAVGVAREALRRNASDLMGYANIGVALICLSACASISANIASRPTVATWVAAVGFALYMAAIVGTWWRIAFHGLPSLIHRASRASRA